MKNKYLTEEETKIEIDDYIRNTKISYALLLNGGWGSGKTYFIKEYINELRKEYISNKNKEKDYKKIVYISLYGIASIAEIKFQLLYSLYEPKKLKKFNSFINFFTKSFFSSFKEKTSIDIQEALNLLEKNNFILFLDDIERCSIPINIILGYVNELVEHNNVKVILVADEEKIGNSNYENNLELKYLVSLSSNITLEKKDDLKKSFGIKEEQNKKLSKEQLKKITKDIFDEDAIYKEVKEKVIGKVIYFRSDISKIYEKFVNQIVEKKIAKQTAIENKDFILKITEENNHHNLRTIQFILHSYNRLINESLKYIVNQEVKEVYVNDLFKYCAIKSMKIKQGDTSYNWEKGQSYGVVYLGDNLIDYVYGNYTNGFKFVDDYLYNSYINKQEIETTLVSYEEKIINEINNPNDPINKLKEWWILPEEEIKIQINRIEEKIKSNQYKLNVYSNIVSILSKAEMIGIYPRKVKIIIKQMEKNIEDGLVQGIYSEDHIFDGPEEAATIYKKKIQRIRELTLLKENKEYVEKLNSPLELENWGEEFYKVCKEMHGNILQEKKFMSILNIEKIIENIKKREIVCIYDFLYAIQSIYKYDNISEYYLGDIDKLIELKDRILMLELKDKVKKHALRLIVKNLNEIIEKLNKRLEQIKNNA